MVDVSLQAIKRGYEVMILNPNGIYWYDNRAWVRKKNAIDTCVLWLMTYHDRKCLPWHTWTSPWFQVRKRYKWNQHACWQGYTGNEGPEAHCLYVFEHFIRYAINTQQDCAILISIVANAMHHVSLPLLLDGVDITWLNFWIMMASWYF